MRADLRRILLTSGVPSIVVTHDRMEAVALGDWMAVMVEGRIRQAGPVQEVFRHPADTQVAESVGETCCVPLGCTAPMPSMETSVALVVCQVRVADCPG